MEETEAGIFGELFHIWSCHNILDSGQTNALQFAYCYWVDTPRLSATDVTGGEVPLNENETGFI